MKKTSRFFVVCAAVFLLIITIACQLIPSNTIDQPGQIDADIVESATVKPTKTRAPTRTVHPKTPTPDYDLTSTAFAAPGISILEDLHEKNLISSSSGIYHKLPDFDKSWAQILWYQWWQTGYSPTNFIIQANVSWDSASTTANWPDSGCGFVYHEADKYNNHRTYLAMDGYVYSDRWINGIYTSLKGGYYGKLKTPSDSAKIMLIVENQVVTFLVNDQKVVSFQDTKLQGGRLAYSLASGTNKEYGIHCSWDNIEFWQLPEGDD